MKNELEKIKLKSEEVQDIVERMPHKTPRLIAIIITLLALLMISFGFLIKYPEHVTGSITLVAKDAPTRHVMQKSGRIKLLGNSTNETVREGQVFAMVETSTRLKDALYLDSVLHISAYSFLKQPLKALPDTLVLGDLNDFYFRLKINLGLFQRFSTTNVYDSKRKGIFLDLNSKKKTIKTFKGNSDYSTRQPQYCKC